MKYYNFLKKQFIEVFRDISALGSLMFIILAIIFLIFIDYKSALVVIIGLILIEIIGSLIKLIFNKIRPNKQKFANILEKIDAGSFPSIHSARTLLIGLSIFHLFSSKIVLLFIALIVLLVGISRLVLKKHYVIDVITGYFLGFLVWYLIRMFLP
jgi:membrane-associated phospholipid phosphatase